MPQGQDYNMINHTMQNFNKSNNHQMTMSQHQAFNKTWNQQISQQRNQEKEKLTLKSILECGAWVLGSWRSPSSSFHSRDGWYFFSLKTRKEGPLEIHSRDGWYFFSLKMRKEGPLEDAIVMQRKMEVWRWVSKMGLWQKWSRTQRSKKILREMNERKLRGLGKWFFGEEIV